MEMPLEPKVQVPKPLFDEARNIVFSYPRMNRSEQINELILWADDNGYTDYDISVVIESIDQARVVF